MVLDRAEPRDAVVQHHPEPGPLRVREIALFADTAPLGTGVKIATGEAAAVPSNQHVIALNQVGFNTDLPKRFTAPVSPDGSKF